MTQELRVSARDKMITVLGEVANERDRQHAKWGEQNHPDGTGPDRWLPPLPTDLAPFSGSLQVGDVRPNLLEAWAKLRCQQAHRDGGDTWEQILTEEWAEAMACDDPVELRAELIQVAAVAVQWVEAIDRRTS